MNITVQYGNGFKYNANSSNVAFLKTDYQIRGLSRPSFNKAKGLPKGTTQKEYLQNKIQWVAGLPMTINVYGVDYSFLNNDFIDYILPFQPLMNIQDQLRQLKGLFKDGVAFTDFQQPSFEIKQNKIVNSVNSKIKPLICGGINNCVKLIGNKTNYKGVSAYPIDVINTSLEFWKYGFTPENRPHLFFKPSNSVRRPIFNSKNIFSGFYQEDIVERFHWFNNGVILPIHGRGTIQGSEPGTCVGYIDSIWID